MRSTLSASCLVVGLVVAATSSAQPALFKDADLKLGMQLIAGNKCDSCHQGRVGGDGRGLFMSNEDWLHPLVLGRRVEQMDSRPSGHAKDMPRPTRDEVVNHKIAEFHARTLWKLELRTSA